ncbi:MAG: hypothetical protein EBS21_02320 [Sphingomonadaceae bacterium]|nr:hypothetical protein [Sphingomonadaceae bacterium]
MATLKEIMAAKAASPPLPAPAKVPVPPPEAFATPVRPGYLGRQDGTEPIPMEWPIDESDFATGKDLIVVQNQHLESYLALKLPSGKVKYLMGPMQTLNLPF